MSTRKWKEFSISADHFSGRCVVRFFCEVFPRLIFIWRFHGLVFWTEFVCTCARVSCCIQNWGQSGFNSNFENLLTSSKWKKKNGTCGTKIFFEAQGAPLIPPGVDPQKCIPFTGMFATGTEPKAVDVFGYLANSALNGPLCNSARNWQVLVMSKAWGQKQ